MDRAVTSSADLLVRVRKLLALATSSNVHEAASAAAAAQALIARHALEGLLADTDPSSAAADPITDGSEVPLESARRPRKWRAVLAEGLASSNGGVAWSRESDGVTHLCFCGRASDRANVAVLWEWLGPRIEWLSATEGPNESRAWHEAFRIGAADAIIERLEGAPDAARASMGDEAARLESALVRVDERRAVKKAAVDAFVAANMRFGKGRNLRVDRRGFARGQAAGNALPLPKRES